jgi:hypothetical protein
VKAGEAMQVFLLPQALLGGWRYYFSSANLIAARCDSISFIIASMKFATMNMLICVGLWSGVTKE